MHKQHKWRFVNKSASVVDICPSFRLTYNALSRHCKDEQGREIERWTAEVNAVEREKNGREGVIKVYDVMHSVKMSGWEMDYLAWMPKCRFDILPSVVMSKIETDESGGREMENKIIERKMAETETDGWKWDGAREKCISALFLGGSCLLFLCKVLFFYLRRTALIPLKMECMWQFHMLCLMAYL